MGLVDVGGVGCIELPYSRGVSSLKGLGVIFGFYPHSRAWLATDVAARLLFDLFSTFFKKQMQRGTSLHRHHRKFDLTFCVIAITFLQWL